MVLQTEIPNNWSGASDSNIRTYIEYLRANSEGRVTASADCNTLLIGNVTIKREYKTNEWGEVLETYTINGRTFYSKDKNFKDISDLFAYGVALVVEKEKKDTGIYPPQVDVTDAQNQSVWHGDIRDDYPSGNPENTDIVNRTVRALFQRHENTIEYGEFGLLTITDDGNGVFQRHALSIDTTSIRLIIEDEQILYNDGKLYPMDAETIAMVYEYLYKREKKLIARKRTMWLLMLLGGGALIAFGVNRCNRYVKESGKKARTVQEYAKTLPNYDDSICVAKSEAELQRLFMLREQNNLKITHFADSINQAK